MSFKPESLASILCSESARSSILGGLFLDTLLILLRTLKCCQSPLGLVLLGAGLLKVALGVLVYCIGHL